MLLTHSFLLVPAFIIRTLHRRLRRFYGPDRYYHPYHRQAPLSRYTRSKRHQTPFIFARESRPIRRRPRPNYCRRLEQVHLYLGRSREDMSRLRLPR
jgi:hypothetical protein